MNIEHWMFLRTSFKNLLLKLTSFSRTYCLASRKAALNASALSTVANLMAKVWKWRVSIFQIQICLCQQHLLLGFVLLTESISKVCLRFPHPCLLIHNITQHLSKRLGHKRQQFCKQHYLANVHCAPSVSHSWDEGPSRAESNGWHTSVEHPVLLLFHLFYLPSWFSPFAW